MKNKTWKINDSFKIKFTNMIEPNSVGIMIRFLPCIDFWWSGDEEGSCKCIGISFIGWELAFWWGKIENV